MWSLSWYEILGFITGAACVWLTVKENVWNWPVGIANAAFWTILFFNEKLYTDSGLQVFYIVMGFAGWYWWLYGGKSRDDLPITKAPLRALAALAVIGALATWGFATFTGTFTDTHYAWPDAITTVVSLIANYMLIRKYLQNWYLWLAVDVAYFVLYWQKDLYLTSILQLAFFVMCIFGIRDWRRTMAKQAKQPISSVKEFTDALGSDEPLPVPEWAQKDPFSLTHWYNQRKRLGKP